MEETKDCTCEKCGDVVAYVHLHDHMRAHSETNAIGIDRRRLRLSTGRPRGARNLNAKHPSSIAKAFKKAGLNWQADFAEAIRGNRRERIKMWLKLLPYLVTTTNRLKVRKWKGKASKAAVIALNALENKPYAE